MGLDFLVLKGRGGHPLESPGAHERRFERLNFVP